MRKQWECFFPPGKNHIFNSHLVSVFPALFILTNWRKSISKHYRRGFGASPPIEKIHLLGLLAFLLSFAGHFAPICRVNRVRMSEKGKPLEWILSYLWRVFPVPVSHFGSMCVLEGKEDAQKWRSINVNSLNTYCQVALNAGGSIVVGISQTTTPVSLD